MSKEWQWLFHELWASKWTLNKFRLNTMVKIFNKWGHLMVPKWLSELGHNRVSYGTSVIEEFSGFSFWFIKFWDKLLAVIRRWTIVGAIGAAIIFAKKLALICPDVEVTGFRPKFDKATGEPSSGVGEAVLEPIELIMRRRWICEDENRWSRNS